jgi:hypothetical protein
VAALNSHLQTKENAMSNSPQRNPIGFRFFDTRGKPIAIHGGIHFRWDTGDRRLGPSFYIAESHDIIATDDGEWLVPPLDAAPKILEAVGRVIIRIDDPKYIGGDIDIIITDGITTIPAILGSKKELRTSHEFSTICPQELSEAPQPAITAAGGAIG